MVRQAVQVAMEYKGTPIKLTYRREEDMMHDYTRQIAMARASGRVENGKVSAMDLGIAMPSVVASQMSRQGISLPGPDAVIVTGAWEQPFDVPNYRVTGYRAKPLAPLSSWRSVGASTNAFFHEGMMDELIRAAGADPLANGCVCVPMSPAARFWKKWARCRIGAHPWVKTVGVDWRFVCRSVCHSRGCGHYRDRGRHSH